MTKSETLESEAYLDIVWRQFKKNHFALAALWILGPLFLVAVFAPLLASNQPLVFHDGQETLYPWFRDLFNPRETVDFVFNMALVGFLPWLVAAIGLNWLWRRGRVPGRVRLLRVAGLYLAITTLLVVAFAFPALRPINKYANRLFVEEEFNSPDKTGLYVPVPFGPTEPDLDANFQPPMHVKSKTLWKDVNDGAVHLLGTDDAGRDVLTRMIYGSRISLTVGFVAVSLYITIGIVLGAIAGYFGGAVDIGISRIIEIVLLFPSFFLILTLVALIGPSIYIIMVVIGLTGWPSIARLTRGEVLKQRSIDYVAAAKALGSSHRRILFRHILPNALSPCLVAIPFGVAGAIITEAGLSLLGFGVRPPTPSWGQLLQLAHQNQGYWWLIVVPSVAIFISVTVFNLIGNGLRDAMDPRLRM